MHNKNRQTQLELFAQSHKRGIPKESLQTSFFEKIIPYEKNIILGICFIIIFILAYSLGMENGKKISIAGVTTRSTVSKDKIRRDPASLKIERIADKTNEIYPNASGAKDAQLQKKEKQKQKIDLKGYTVQVASFRSKSSAEKEKITLEKKGYKAYVLSKNKYIIVCVGIFEDKDTARLSQKKLKRLYSDCLIRKL